MRAWLNLRYTPEDRQRAFKNGLKKLGYCVEHKPTFTPKSDKDILVTWNRIGAANDMARNFENKGLKVVVAENGSWGKSFLGRTWYTLALFRHNTSGCFPIGDHRRFDKLNVNFEEFRIGGEIVILAQRGIGSPPTAMPRNWPDEAYKLHGGRIRRHPGRNKQALSLAEDLKNCGTVITWGSGAAVQALVWGISVKSFLKNWIGEQDNTMNGRLQMFRRMAWAQWEPREIESGVAFDWLLNSKDHKLKAIA